MVDTRNAHGANTSRGLLDNMEGRKELPRTKENTQHGPASKANARPRRAPLPPKTIPLNITSDWTIHLSLRNDGRDTMTPITDMAEMLKSGDLAYLGDYSIRDRMRFVDACVTELVEALHPFLGPRRVDAFYESKVPSHVPAAIESIRKMEVILQSLSAAPSKRSK